MQTISGRHVDLSNVIEDDVCIEDIAHSLHQINRFNGHTVKPYNVLAHSLCAADLMPEGKKMEGLLHDAAEAYTGDIPKPFKNMFPELCVYEDKLLAIILNKLDINKEVNVVKDAYVKSPMMKSVDKRLGMGEHEVLRPNSGDDPDHSVLCLMQQYWNATPQDFIDRYKELL